MAREGARSSATVEAPLPALSPLRLPPPPRVGLFGMSQLPKVGSAASLTGAPGARPQKGGRRRGRAGAAPQPRGAPSGRDAEGFEAGDAKRAQDGVGDADAAAREAIEARERQLERVRQVAWRVVQRGDALRRQGGDVARAAGVDGLLIELLALRDATLAVVEAIVSWREAHGGDAPERPYIW